ncbi:MAG TPA: ABC transporter permease [Planctomycetota bacterium]|nr:ABC transporter permease [Planctomycetota bacterium]
MRRWLAMRLCWLVLMLLGITFVTFVVLDQAPVDRAALEMARAAQTDTMPDAQSRDAAILRLRIRYGMVDPVTLQPAPVLDRYLAWLGRAVTGRLAGPHEDHAALWHRLGEALPVTALLGFLSLLVAFAIGLPLGVQMGMHPGGRCDRLVSPFLFAVVGVPEFLLAALLLLAFSGVYLQWLPATGLRSNGAEQWSFVAQVVDFGLHLCLPVAVMSVRPLVLVTRFVRASVARTLETPFAVNLRALGIEPAIVRRRLLANACAPVATLAGSLLPLLVGGSIVVENLFALDGLGHLLYSAVMRKDQAMVMALVIITSVATLFALLASDLLHRLVDPRVRLSS